MISTAGCALAERILSDHRREHVVLQDRKHIQRELANLISAVPRLLQDDQEGTEFWLEFLELTQAIKEQVPFDRRDLVMTRIHQILVGCGVSPPSWWVLASLAPPPDAPRRSRPALCR
jgi:hypothetical protein